MDITQIILSLIGLIVATITTVLIPYIKSKTTSEQQEKIMIWVRIAVNAAEQLRKTGVINDKKNYVQEFLKSNGYTLDDSAIDALIEAAVWELNKSVISTQ